MFVAGFGGQAIQSAVFRNEIDVVFDNDRCLLDPFTGKEWRPPTLAAVIDIQGVQLVIFRRQQHEIFEDRHRCSNLAVRFELKHGISSQCINGIQDAVGAGE